MPALTLIIFMSFLARVLIHYGMDMEKIYFWMVFLPVSFVIALLIDRFMINHDRS